MYDLDSALVDFDPISRSRSPPLIDITSPYSRNPPLIDISSPYSSTSPLIGMSDTYSMDSLLIDTSSPYSSSSPLIDFTGSSPGLSPAFTSGHGISLLDSDVPDISDDFMTFSRPPNTRQPAPSLLDVDIPFTGGNVMSMHRSVPAYKEPPQAFSLMDTNVPYSSTFTGIHPTTTLGTQRRVRSPVSMEFSPPRHRDPFAYLEISPPARIKPTQKPVYMEFSPPRRYREPVYMEFSPPRRRRPNSPFEDEPGTPRRRGRTMPDLLRTPTHNPSPSVWMEPRTDYRGPTSRFYENDPDSLPQTPFPVPQRRPFHPLRRRLFSELN